MNYRGEKIWFHFPQDIIAPDVREAAYLALFQKWTNISRTYLRHLEVVDLQQYRLVTRKNKIYNILRRPPSEQAFLFIINKN